MIIQLNKHKIVVSITFSINPEFNKKIFYWFHSNKNVTKQLCSNYIFPAEPRETRSPKGADRSEAHLNDVRFKLSFFINDDCLKVDIQFQKFLNIPKFGLTEGVIFNSENCKLSWWQKRQCRQISEMGRENSKKKFCIAFRGV